MYIYFIEIFFKPIISKAKNFLKNKKDYKLNRYSKHAKKWFLKTSKFKTFFSFILFGFNIKEFLVYKSLIMLK